MSERIFVEWFRNLVAYLRNGGVLSDEVASELENIQDRLASTYENYEGEKTPEAAAPLRDLMMESLQLTHDGIEDLLEFEESEEHDLLSLALSKIEEGNDILESLKYTVEQDASWSGQAPTG